MLLVRDEQMMAIVRFIENCRLPVVC